MKDYHFCKRLRFLSMVCLITLSLCGTAMAQKFNGIWTGEWLSSHLGGSGTVSVTLIQTGPALNGSVTIYNAGECQANSTFPITAGSAPDATAFFSSSGGACGAPVTLSSHSTVSGNTMSGYYLASASGQPWDIGTFTVNGGTGLTGNFSGAWTGNWLSSLNGGGSGAETITITQTGGALSGNVTVSPVGPCQGTYASTLTGSISGFAAGFTGTINVCGESSSVGFIGNVSGNILSGSWFDYGGSEIIDFGTFSVTSSCTPPTFPGTVYTFFDPAAAPLNPKFIWSGVPDANLYHAWICSDSNCSSIVLGKQFRIERWHVASGLNPNTQYWFKVRSVNFCGIGQFSAATNFTTSSCAYDLSCQGLACQGYGYDPQGGAGTVTVTPSSDSCTWNATSNDPWITVTSGNSGMGNGTVSYYVDANATGNARTGSITIGGQGFMVRQAKDIFIDDPQDPSTPYINAIYVKGITKGCNGSSAYYCPSDPVTRSAMAVFIIRGLYGDSFGYTQTPYFTDVPPEYEAFSYIQKMKDVGITQNAGTYNIADPVTRYQMAVFLVRVLYGDTFDYNPTPYFNDVPASHGAFKYIQKMKDVGITQGCGNGNFCPDGVVTRDQMAVFLARTFLGLP